MRTVAHLSDLHFGREDPRVVEAVLQDVDAQHPDLVVVSGDLTQRARRGQFQAARAFLDRFKAPVLVVPGNHDIPLFDLARRFFRPLKRYRSFGKFGVSPWLLMLQYGQQRGKRLIASRRHGKELRHQREPVVAPTQ